jgi:uncharacterized peroxidase-related enzyme
MSRIQAINPETATGKAKDLLNAVKSKLGLVPNMMRSLANAPSALEGYLNLSGALSKGSFNAKTREQIALAVGQANNCDYCLSAHSAFAKMAGLSPDQIRDARQGNAIDSKTDALIRFARKVVDQRGRVSDSDVQEVREAGFDDSAITEVVANVALNIFTNYFNIVGDTEIDFPEAEELPVENAETCSTGVCSR